MREMIVNTRRLFTWLLPALGVDVVCDVGSMNGTDALAFRAAVPRAQIFAFEANPENFRLMQADPALRQGRIQLAHLAATNFDGEAEFFVVQADYSTVNGYRGMSSLHRRPEEHDLVLATVPVKTTRLDSFLPSRIPPGRRSLALWIDVEGKAYEVIEGAAGLLDAVQMLHVEVENAPCIAPGQKLYADVAGLLAQMGFVPLATDAVPHLSQLNALFVRRDLPAETRALVDRYVTLARVRLLVTSTIRRLAARLDLRIPAR